MVVFGGSDGGGDDASPPAGKGSVDISDLDDPTTTGPAKETTTTTTETTTTVVAADGRIVVDADNGFAWTMATAPDIETPLPGVQTWTAVDGDTTETVRIITGTPNDLDAVLAEQVEGYDAGSYKLSKVQESHIEEADGRTASFTGTTEDGDPIVGYIVGAMVGDQAVFAMTTRTDSTLDDLYLDFLKLPASFDLG